jgi:cytochrome c-type biogenesis protein CcmH/NrfF
VTAEGAPSVAAIASQLLLDPTSPSKGGFPLWAIPIIVVGLILIAGLIIFLALRNRGDESQSSLSDLHATGRTQTVVQTIGSDGAETESIEMTIDQDY